MQTYIDEQTLISLQLSGKESDKYPQAIIRDASGQTIQVIDLVHMDGGLYGETTSIGLAGNYTIQYNVFSDAAHLNTDALYEESTAEELDVRKSIADSVWNAQAADIQPGSMGELMHKVLGLSKSNFRISDPVYDSKNNLTSCTFTTYMNALDCENDENALAGYTVDSVYDAKGRVSSYKVKEI